VLVPVLIFLAGLSAGAIAGARWLPDLAAGQVGGLAFFLVCGLLGAAVGLAGVNIFEIVEEINRVSPTTGNPEQAIVVAAGLRDIIFECGSLLGFAAVIYLLAPPPDIDEESVVQAAA